MANHSHFTSWLLLWAVLLVFQPLRAQLPSTFTIDDELPSSGILTLPDGSLISHAASSAGDYFRFRKVSPEGRVLRNVGFNLRNAGQMVVCLDTLHHRLFFTTRGGIMQPIKRGVWTPQMRDFLNLPVFQKRMVVCLDTGFRLLWASAFSVSNDSLGNIYSLLPDGAGGVYVTGGIAGSISEAIQSNPDGQYPGRLKKGGYTFITRLGRNGKVKWQRSLSFDALSTPLRPTGFAFLLTRNARQFEVLVPFADTLISHYHAQPDAKPNQFRLHLTRFDSSGNQVRSRWGFWDRGNFFPESEFPLELVRSDSTNKTRFLLWADELSDGGTNQRSALLQFDTAWNCIKATVLPFARLDGSLADLGKFRLAVYGMNPTTGERHFLRLPLNRLSPSSWVVARYPCNTLVNLQFPNLAVRKQPNGSTDAIFQYRSGGVSQSVFRLTCPSLLLKEVGPLPCQPFKPLSNAPLLQDSTAAIQLGWMEGNVPWDSVNRPVWRDSSLTLFNLARVENVRDNCLTYKGLSFQDTSLCAGDSLVLWELGSSARSVRLLNGQAVPFGRFFTVRGPGTYIIEQYDTCALSYRIRDTLRVRESVTLPLLLEPDTLVLCPGETKRPGVVNRRPDHRYRWETAGPVPPDSAQALFRADSLFFGIRTFRLTRTAPGFCPTQDSLVLVNSPGPTVAGIVSQGDSLLWLPGRSPFRFDWAITGGRALGSLTDDSVRIRWEPFFEGQAARLRVRDEWGCAGETVFLRKRDSVETLPAPVPDWWIPTLITPNGDGENDRFEIVNIQPGDQAEVEIYNRWGSRVFESKAYRREFPEATSTPDGVYFVRIRLVGIRKQAVREAQYQTWLMLIRP